MRYLSCHPELAPISVLMFGCASIGGRVGRREGLRALEQAHALGINAFDTARSYGFGDGERILGEFLRVRPRDRVVVVGKAGIFPSKQASSRRVLRAVGRTFMKFVPADGIRRWKRLAHVTGAAPPPVGAFEPARLRASLETSLRELNTDYLDVFLLHAVPPEILGRAEVFEFLDKVRQEGKARLVGVSGGATIVGECARAYPGIVDALQYPLHAGTVLDEDVLTKSFAGVRMLMQPFGGGRLLHELERSAEVQALTGGSRQTLSALLVATMLEVPKKPAAVLMSAWNPEHLRRNVELADHTPFSRETLIRFAEAARTTTQR